MYIAALVFEFHNSILTNKIHRTYHEMQAANKTNKNESMNCTLFFISRQHYCIISVASLKKVYSCIWVEL